jgi:hypothetical protein
MGHRMLAFAPYANLTGEPTLAPGTPHVHFRLTPAIIATAARLETSPAPTIAAVNGHAIRVWTLDWAVHARLSLLLQSVRRRWNLPLNRARPRRNGEPRGVRIAVGLEVTFGPGTNIELPCHKLIVRTTLPSRFRLRVASREDHWLQEC